LISEPDSFRAETHGFVFFGRLSFCLSGFSLRPRRLGSLGTPDSLLVSLGAFLMRSEPQRAAALHANSLTDLSNCATEQIHIPGMIHPHGLLLVLDAECLVIRQVFINSSVLF
jgi:hypothetical protein